MENLGRSPGPMTGYGPHYTVIIAIRECNMDAEGPPEPLSAHDCCWVKTVCFHTRNILAEPLFGTVCGQWMKSDRCPSPTPREYLNLVRSSVHDNGYCWPP